MTAIDRSAVLEFAGLALGMIGVCLICYYMGMAIAWAMNEWDKEKQRQEQRKAWLKGAIDGKR